MRKHLFKAGVVAAAAALIPAAVFAQASAHTELTVADQAVAPGASQITVAAAGHTQDFYIVVHEGDASKFGADIGNTVLMKAGNYTNVTVPLKRAVKDGEVLWPMLHTDDNLNGSYDGPATDKPVSDATAGNSATGNVVTFSLTVTEQAGAPTAPRTGMAGILADGSSSALAVGLLAALAVTVTVGGRAMTRRSR